MQVVNLELKKCTCRRFDHEKIPCINAIAAVEHKDVSRISLCDPKFMSVDLVNGWGGSIMPPNESVPVPVAVDIQPCLPPIVVNPQGRPKKRRIKSSLEVAIGKKRPRKQHASSRCKQVGHNVKNCRM
ncbi:PREDICTED: uncharacterized protein LOC104763181 [Camelina sativa]|uniref:Uncharacterized protein LOC104763181 n=1 Tax=Camelina sativa TaxID=90675 RepID=A0ABM0XEU5_CAMSA|nr:PREDICTED: uncharacterized protein LOC104763181 [Camelina sativa]